MTNYAFLLDLGRCIGCQACVAACKTGNEQPVGTQYIDIGQITWGSYPDLQGGVTNKRCYHCSDAACVEVCPTGALFKEDGLTRVDPTICTSCGYCQTACPFDIPKMVNGRVSKCDGCAAVVKAGGVPWCVKTCPSQALVYGPRDKVMAEAQIRAAALYERNPHARIYGDTECCGLGVVMILPHDPSTMNLPSQPQVSGVTATWQNVVQPTSVGLTGLSVLITGIAAIIARRIHNKELKELEVGTLLQPTVEEMEDDRALEGTDTAVPGRSTSGSRTAGD